VTTSAESSTEAGRQNVAENMRRETIAALKTLDSIADPDFTRLTRLAAQVFEAPIGLVALLDDDRVWIYARHGTELEQVSAEASLVAATVTVADLPNLVVPDAAADPHFAADELVAGEPRARFYAGVPIIVHGQRIGALCVLSPTAREEVEGSRIGELADLAGLAGSLFELKDEARVRARMAADLIREEWRHALTLEAGKVGSWVWDLRSGEIVSNDIFRQMFGLSVVNPINFEDIRATIDPADLEAVNNALEQTFEEGGDYSVEFRVASTGRWLIGRGRVYQRDGAGKPLVMMGVNIDVTDARAAAEQTRLLLRELNHRVKNTLAMIQSLARQTMRQKPDPQLFIDSFSGRLRTLSEAHALLSERDWSGIGLIELVHSQVEPYLLDSPEQLVMKGEDVQLPPDHALGLGLVLHELASNAEKYGALSNSHGEVTVSWTVENGCLYVTWKEVGGPRIENLPEAGFGSRLIQRGLDKVLDSSVSLSFPPEGAEARIVMPLD
jgi:two-component sensor histidine kinase/PAS domain-containing protein